MTFKDKPTFENKLVWGIPNSYRDLIGREDDFYPHDQSYQGKIQVFTWPIWFRTWAGLYTIC